MRKKNIFSFLFEVLLKHFRPDGSARTPRWHRAGTPIAPVDVEDEVAVGLVNGQWTPSRQWTLPSRFVLSMDSVAAVDSTAMGGRSGCRIKRRQRSQTSLVQRPVFLPIPLFHPFSYDATLCCLGRTTPHRSAKFPFPHLNLMPRSMS